MYFVCKNCLISFKAIEKRIFCSKKCYSIFQKWKPFSWISANNTWSKRTDKQKENISIAHMWLNSWEKHPNWKWWISKDKNKYQRNQYKNLSEEKRKEVVWRRWKRNRLKWAIIKELWTHTYGEWELLKIQYNHTCPCCKLSEPFIGQRSLNLTEDHIIPLSKGWSDLIENIQPLCLSCNIKKHTRIIKY